MSLPTASLENSDGTVIKDPADADLSSAIDRVGASLTHCILDLGDAGFVQAAGTPGRLTVEYRDGSGMYQSTGTALDAATVQGIFIDARNGRTGWKQEIAFEPIPESGPEASGAGIGHGGDFAAAPGARRSVSTRGFASAGAGGMLGARGIGARRQRGPRTLKDQVARTAGREVRFGIGRIIGRFIRSLLRGRMR